MTYFITAVGILYVIFGVIYFVRPDYAMAIIEFFKVGKRIYIAKVVKAVFGVLLIVCAQGAVIAWVPRAIGILAVAGIVVVYALGTQRVYAMMDWFKSEKRIRVMAVVAELLGILLIYSA